MDASDAWLIEQRLHKYFSEKAPFQTKESDMPFYGDGQSELYVEDVLELDPKYSREQGAAVKRAILKQRMASAGASEDEIDERQRIREDMEEVVESIRSLAKRRPFSWLMILWEKLFVSPAEIEERVRAQEEVQRIKDHRSEQYLRERREKMNKVMTPEMKKIMLEIADEEFKTPPVRQ